jgi:TetR/AcrR family transcriptional regulator, lmrAB and yxaGH operons repressor
MPAPLIAKEEVIARITRTFQAQGYDGTSLSDLSRETGLVKASLYHYFPDGKKGMAEAALEAFSQTFAQLVIAPLLSDADPRDRLLAMIDGMNTAYNGGDDLCLFALLSVGDTKDLFHASITPKVQQLLLALSNTLLAMGLTSEQAANRTEQLIVEVEGALIVSRVMGDPGIFKRTLKRMQDQISR